MTENQMLQTAIDKARTRTAERNREMYAEITAELNELMRAENDERTQISINRKRRLLLALDVVIDEQDQRTDAA